MAKVVEVLSGDSLIVSLPDGGGERRLYLASIRCPRPGNLVRQNSKEEESMAQECKEFVRKKLIGKQVKVRVIQTPLELSVSLVLSHPLALAAFPLCGISVFV